VEVDEDAGGREPIDGDSKVCDDLGVHVGPIR
jgi:hypothetical protein